MKEFFKRRAKGEVPDYICDLFDKASAEKDGERKVRTTIVNKLFTRAAAKKKSKKSWSIDLSKPYFQEVKQRFVLFSVPPTYQHRFKQTRTSTYHSFVNSFMCRYFVLSFCLVKFANRCLYTACVDFIQQMKFQKPPKQSLDMCIISFI